MHLRKIVLLVLLSFSLQANCQQYRHNVGAGYAIRWRYNNTGNISTFDLSGTIGFRYMAALKFSINDKIDFVPSIDPFFIFFPSFTFNGTGIGGSVDVPLDLKFYFKGIDNTSFFLGTGVDFYSILWNSTIKPSRKSFGPQLCLGFQVKIGRLGFGGRLSYTYGLLNEVDGPSTVRTNLTTIGAFLVLPSPGEMKARREQ